MIRLAVVDDHPAIATALAAAIHATDDVELVGTVTSAAGAAELVETADPDVLVCDIWLDGEPAGLDVLATTVRATRDGRPRVLILSGFDQPSFLRAAFEGGAAGYVSKASPVEAILDAVRIVADGGTAFPEVTLRALRDAPRRPSARELGAIRLLARGASNDEIAVGLGISVKTVESHLRRLFGRYGVLSRTELAMLAVREGWLGSEP
ncbi:MAG TPA: response regulator transcription factor [Candidatus Limnocylindrales bacterium]|nr:response regulator transcription factor [Candidatus Limnocylindrales bacterium]